MHVSEIRKNKVIQIGIVVRDLEKTAAAWERFLGISPSVDTVKDYSITKATYKGQPCYGLLKQAIFDLGNVQIELISPYGDEASAWRDSMEQDGEGLHHLAFFADDTEKAAKEMEALGYPLMQTGHWPDEPKDGTYAYFDARGGLKSIIELLNY